MKAPYSLHYLYLFYFILFFLMEEKNMKANMIENALKSLYKKL